MRRITETNENPFELLLGETVTLLCAAYFYTGKLTGVNDTCLEISDPSIVYETGAWTEEAWKDSQKMNVKTLNVMRQAIESFGVLK